VITSRPNAVESSFLANFKRIIEIQDLSEESISNFIDNFFNEEPLKKSMKKVLQDKTFFNMVKSPLNLTISCILLEDQGEEIFDSTTGEIEERNLYEKIIRLLTLRYY
jgi:hypothetical protein